MARSKGDLAELAWIWSIVGYSLLRFFVAWGAFAEHGANAWVFGIIDIGTAWPYAKSVAVVCRRAAASQWSRLPMPLAVAVATFFAPYAYLWFAAGRMPTGVRASMVICVSVLLCAATAGALSKTRKLRRANPVTAVADDIVIDLRVADVAAGTPADDIVIDLRGADVRGGASADDIVIDLRVADVAAGTPADDMVVSHRVHDGPTELLIDLTREHVSLRRTRI